MHQAEEHLFKFEIKKKLHQHQTPLIIMLDEEC